MHKRKVVRVVSTIVVFAIALLAVSTTRAESPVSPWVSAALSIQKQADALAPPSSYPNLDCAMDITNACTVPTSYGTGSTNSTVRFNNETLSLYDKGKFYPVYTYLENRQRFLPVPYSNEAISYTGGPAIGLYLYFNYSFSSSVVRTGGLGTLLPVEYHITKPPDGKLADKANHLIPADTASMGFSSNGEWMVVSSPNMAVMRVNLRTFDVLPFAPSFNYSIGLDPAVKTAITNDGRYAIVSSSNLNTFKLYDLGTCPAVPNTINGPVACQSRDLQAFTQQQILGYSFVSGARFMNDDSLAFFAVYKVGGVSKTARFIISNGGSVSQLDYLALGDSYISGEGAFDYISGTDIQINKCHLSYLSYPFLIGQELNFNSPHSVACSGATTNDIVNTSSSYVGQADRKNKTTRANWDQTGQSELALSSFLPGYVDQLDFVSRYQPKNITVSIGGNNVNMIGTLKQCIWFKTCMETYEDRLEFINTVNSDFNDIEKTYEKIKNAGPPDMRVYAIGYPQIAKPGGDCGLNVHLNSDEVLFASQAIDYLDSVVKAAAAKAGVFYVDAEDALYGHRLCEAKPGSVSVNGITAGNDIGPIGSESFHPNAFGHELMENRVLEATHNLKAVMPAPDTNAGIPNSGGLEILNAPHSGRPVNTTEFDQLISDDLAYRDVPFNISIDGARHALPANASLTAELHSSPTNLGTFSTNPGGNLSAQITIPSSVPAGYHSLHFYGVDLLGQPIDIYKDIFVAASADDLDGNGTPDEQQKCVGVDPSGQDYDQDGIDDACDGEIGLPPARPSEPAAVTGNISTQSPQVVTFAPSNNTHSPAVNEVSMKAQTQSASPKVLSASTTAKNNQPPKPKDLRLSPIYLFYGLGALLVVSLVLSLV